MFDRLFAGAIGLVAAAAFLLSTAGAWYPPGSDHVPAETVAAAGGAGKS
ncbi:hypothetical protein [Salinisphaera sp. PC39]